MATDLVFDILEQEGDLEHHGIKGMRWGVRRKVGPDGRVVGKSKPKPSSDFKSTAPLRKRPPSTLSNMQLKKVNERMQLESKFNKMNPSRKTKGKAFVNDVLKTTVGVGGTAAVVKIASNPKTLATLQKGAQVIKQNSTKSGRLLGQVARGAYG